MPPGEVAVASKEVSQPPRTADHALQTEKQLTPAQYYWKLLRDSIKATVNAVVLADINDIDINHGVTPIRKLCSNRPIVQVLANPNTKEYLTIEEGVIRFYKPDGRKKEVVTVDEPINRLCYSTMINQYVGWLHGQNKMVLMDADLNVFSVAKAQTEIYTMIYNENSNEIVTGGLGCITSWVFRYGNRHLIPRKTTIDVAVAGVELSLLTLEQTASRNQRVFGACGSGVVVFNLYEGKLIALKKELHVRNITSLLFFNPMKYLITGARDGSIKVWNDKWHLQLVFVGHCDVVSALAVYPYGPFIMSASHDATIRVWSLETCDEVDEIETEEPIEGLGTLVHEDDFFTYTTDSVDLWSIKHIHELHTSIGHKVRQMRMTIHPDYPHRCMLLCKDSSVRIINPVSGSVITTMLLNPKEHQVVDAAYAIHEGMIFASLSNGNILKYRTDSNPCVFVDEWKCKNPDRACNKLLVYEYVLSLSDGNAWTAVTKAITANQLHQAANAPQRSSNKTILLTGRKDGYICVLSWLTGAVDFKIEGHGGKGVLGMVANTKDDQLITSGRDNIIKIWRVYPFADETLNPLMSFYCAHTPVHMTVMKSKLAVAFQDHMSATFNIVTYNLKTRNRSDHSPDDDHTDGMTGMDCCPKMKLFASSSNDGTVRIWDENNRLIRCIKLNAKPISMAFCSQAGDILVGIGNHVHKISHKMYLPRTYMNRKILMRIPDGKVEHALPFDEKILAGMSNWAVKRLKAAHSSFKFTHFVDVLSAEETEEVMREQNLRDKMFALLTSRDEELRKIKGGHLTAHKKPRSTKATKQEAFDKYLQIFYDRPKVEAPEDNLFEDDAVQEALEPESEPAIEPYKPDIEPTGFFPPPATAKSSRWHPGTPLEPVFPRVNASGYVPNSVLIKLLWPDHYEKTPEERKKSEEAYRPPQLTDSQMEQIAKLNAKREDLELTKVYSTWSDSFHSVAIGRSSAYFDPERHAHLIHGKPLHQLSQASELLIPGSRTSRLQTHLELHSKTRRRSISLHHNFTGPIEDEKTMSVREPSEYEFEDRTIVLSDEEEVKSPKPRESKFLSKMHEAMERPLTPAMEPPPSGQDVRPQIEPDKPKPPKKIQKPQRPIVKFVSRPPPPPPRERTPPPPTPTPPPPREPTPVPNFILQFKGEPWFDKYFPNCNHNTLPKPWTVSAFVQMLLRLVQVADMHLKPQVIQALKKLYQEESFDNATKQHVVKTVLGVLNPPLNPPSAGNPLEATFITESLNFLNVLDQHGRDYITELMCQFIDGSMELRNLVLEILNYIGVNDPHHYFPKEIDNWDIWSIEGPDRKVRVKKVCHQWLEKWLASFKIHIQDAIERIQHGHSVQGRLNKKSILKGQSATVKQAYEHRHELIRRNSLHYTAATILDSIATGRGQKHGSPDGLTVTFDQSPDRGLVGSATYVEAINYFCEMEHEKELDKMRRLKAEEKVVDAKNTVLVLPQLQIKPNLVRLGEMHTSRCRPDRETTYEVDFKLPPVTNRGHQPIPGQIHGFAPSINLPMKTLYMNPFPSAIDAYDPWHQEPILLTLKSSQKYFIPAQSYVPDLEGFM